METVRVQLPDGSVREVARGTTPLQIAESISPRLAAAVVVARIQPLAPTADGTETSPGNVVAETLSEPGETALESSEAAMYSGAPTSAARIVDLTAPLTEDVSLSLLKDADPDSLRVLRHSAAHVMATALLELFPDTKLGHGPATDNGFFYDVFRPTPFTESNLAAIEARMAEVVARDEPFTCAYERREQALAEYAAHGDFMKLHFVERFTQPGDEVSLYKNGNFTDFCR